MDLSDAVQRAFAPAHQPGRIGAEAELIAMTDTDAPKPVDPAVLADGFDPAFVAAARPTFEPGGQLELSPPPRRTVAGFVNHLHRLLARATAIAGERGVRLEPVGTNPYHSCADVPLRTLTPRYVAMQDEFDRLGPNGRRMMRLTASLQVSVDLLPGRDGVEQWLVANLAGPALTVAFANSTAIDGRPTSTPGARTRIWQGVDMRRTGYDGRHLDPADPIGAYLAFASAAPRLAIPETADPVYHLSTLFPPVRPRGGYLEVRYLDAQPYERIGEAVATIAHLLYDRRARRDALDLLLPRASDHDRAWCEAAAGHSPESNALLSIARTARSVAGGALVGGVS
ncbi:MAG TPA: glutamate-cysteine ligase family protein [Jiangellales bacterium]|nr:glutamate-cysteine ligase family protein [Jiangellales bacterium]